MKPVYSNPKGHHIHSPFAFELVSGVIFRSVNKAEKDLQKMWEKTNQNFQRLLLIHRLIEFFQPSAVWAPAGKKEMMELSVAGLPDINLRYFEGNPLPVLTFSNEWVIVDQPVDMYGFEFVTNCNSVWFIEDLNHADQAGFFSSVKNHPKVSQTYALKNCGIVIFNPRYQKQDFMIRGRYPF